ncbi:MAG: hypothetical protein H7Y03_15525, partial [Chitinophagaceae bacterium]|nr:hypothetical protein [Chitinophagaceae bacterium]
MRKTIACAALLGALIVQQIFPSPLLALERRTYGYQDIKIDNMKRLRTLLKELEARYKVSFMYKSEIINETLEVPPCSNCNTIEAELGFILKPAGFRYEKI